MAHLPGPELRTVVRAHTPRGEIALRERVIPRPGDAVGEIVHELIVAGIFAMDTRDVSTEVALAEACLAQVESPSRVLIGGLGLGFTAWAALKDRRVAHLDIVELEEDLLVWARLGLTPTLGVIARHPRAHLHRGDVAITLALPADADQGEGGNAVPGDHSEGIGALPDPDPGEGGNVLPSDRREGVGALPGPDHREKGGATGEYVDRSEGALMPSSGRDAPPSPASGPWDLVLLDVDNGPGFLVHQANAALYSTGALRSALGHIRPGGALAIWAAQREPALWRRLTALAPTEEILLPVTREGLDLTYAIYLARP